MRKWVLVGAGLAAATLVTVLVITGIGYVDRGTSIASAHRQSAQLHAQLVAAHEANAKAAKAARRDAARDRVLRARLAAALGRYRLGRSPIPHRVFAATPEGDLEAFAPKDARIQGVTDIKAEADRPELLVVLWKRGDLRDLAFDDVQLTIWRATYSRKGVAREDPPDRTWHVAYSLRIDNANGKAFSGPGAHITRTAFPNGPFLDYSTGDVTGDGQADVLALEGGGGSGGCGESILLVDGPGGGVHPAYRHFQCDGGVSIRHRQLFVTAPVSGKGCGIHGCGGVRRVTTLRWNGRRMVRVRTRIQHLHF